LGLGGEKCGLTEEALRKILPTMTSIEKLSLKGMHHLGAALGLSLTVLCPSLLKFVNTQGNSAAYILEYLFSILPAFHSGLLYLFTGNKSMNVGLKVQSKDCIEFIEKEGKAAFFFFGFLFLGFF